MIYTDENIPERIRRPIGLGVSLLMEDEKLILYAQVNPENKLPLVYQSPVRDVFVSVWGDDENLNDDAVVKWLFDKQEQKCFWAAVNWLAKTMHEKHFIPPEIEE